MTISFRHYFFIITFLNLIPPRTAELQGPRWKLWELKSPCIRKLEKVALEELNFFSLLSLIIMRVCLGLDVVGKHIPCVLQNWCKQMHIEKPSEWIENTEHIEKKRQICKNLPLFKYVCLIQYGISLNLNLVKRQRHSMKRKKRFHTIPDVSTDSKRIQNCFSSGIHIWVIHILWLWYANIQSRTRERRKTWVEANLFLIFCSDRVGWK